jgi:hypothetical protein
VQGAWAPWKCAEAGGNPDDSKHINPRHILSHTPLQLQLGQPVTLHFVATDYLGCPAVLSHQHRRELLETGLQMEPVDDGECWGRARASECVQSARQHMLCRTESMLQAPSASQQGVGFNG